MSERLTADQIDAALKAASEKYECVTLITLARLTEGLVEGKAESVKAHRPCYAVKIAGGSAPGRIGLYFIGGVLANRRNWHSADTLVHFIESVARVFSHGTILTLGGTKVPVGEKVVTEGGKTFAKEDIQKIVKQLDIFVFPLVNPDGRDYTMSKDDRLDWEKNRRLMVPGDKDAVGVNIDRNYPFLWDYEKYLDPHANLSGMSKDPSKEAYIGPSDASEAETTNVISILDTYPNIRFFVDQRSSESDAHGGITYPWHDAYDNTLGYDDDMTFRNATWNHKRGKLASDYKEWYPSYDMDITKYLAKRIQTAVKDATDAEYGINQGYDGNSPISGVGIDYAYSRYFGNSGKGKVISFRIRSAALNTGPKAKMELGKRKDEGVAGLLELCLAVLDDNADVYIRDNLKDNGSVPSPGLSGEGVSPDIFIRQKDDDELSSEWPILGKSNYIYVRVKNKGPAMTRHTEVSVRVVTYLGTEFKFPYDWVTKDTSHLEPKLIRRVSDDIKPNASDIAKFELSAERVATLRDDAGHWNANVLAWVVGSNDYSTPVDLGTYVWENNNLAQLSISPFGASSNGFSSSKLKPPNTSPHDKGWGPIPFMVGHVRNPGETVTLVIDRQQLPKDAKLFLDPYDRTRHYNGVKFMSPGRPDKAVLSQQGVTAARHNGRPMMELSEPRATIKLPKKPGQMRQVSMYIEFASAPKRQRPYEINISQLDDGGKVAGGITLRVPGAR